jgi:hypothetical protein
VVGIALGLVPFAVVAVVQWRWAFLEEQMLFAPAQTLRASLRTRLVVFFTSASYWTPLTVVKCWGSVFAMYQQRTRWFHAVLLGTNVATAVIVGASKSTAACPTQITLIALLYVGQLGAIVFLRPFRQPFLQVLSVVTCMVRLVEMLALAAFVWAGTTTGTVADSVGYAMHMASDSTLVLLTVLCAVAAVLDRVLVTPAVKLREEDLMDSVNRATSREFGDFVVVDNNGLASSGALMSFWRPQTSAISSRITASNMEEVDCSEPHMEAKLLAGHQTNDEEA